MTATATATAAAATAALSFVSVVLIAGIVAGQSQTNLTTEILQPEDTSLRYVKNETTDDRTTRTLPTTYSKVQTTPPTTYSTVQTTHVTTSAEPKIVTSVKPETSSKPKTATKPRPRSSTTTTGKTTTVPNPTVSSNETDQTTKATTPGLIIGNSTEGNVSVVSKSHLNITTTVEVVSTTQANNPTEVTKSDSLKRFSHPREGKPETTPTPTISTEETTFFQKPENSTVSTEDTEKDLIEQEQDETINYSMPQFPEIVLSNETHFKFHQDPEEAALDERITQIARQLAETGLRREYEERKLGHFIPISVRPIEYVTSNYHSKSKSIKFVKGESPDYKPSHHKSTLLKFLTKAKSGPGIENLDKTTYELVTNLPEILRKNKSDKQIREMNGLIKVGGKDTTDKMASTNYPMFFELGQNSEKGNVGTETKSEPQSTATTTTAKDLTTRGRRFTDDTTYYTYTETTDNS